MYYFGVSPDDDETQPKSDAEGQKRRIKKRR
jgi:hypothetical protein